MQNKYIVNGKIKEKKFREILKYFCEDFTATQTARLGNISRNTVNRIYNKIRARIVELAIHENPLYDEVEVDESYFGAKRIRGKRGRGAGEKIPVVGLLKRDGKVYTKIVNNCTKEGCLN